MVSTPVCQPFLFPPSILYLAIESYLAVDCGSPGSVSAINTEEATMYTIVTVVSVA